MDFDVYQIFLQKGNVYKIPKVPSSLWKFTRSRCFDKMKCRQTYFIWLEIMKFELIRLDHSMCTFGIRYRLFFKCFVEEETILKNIIYIIFIAVFGWYAENKLGPVETIQFIPNNYRPYYTWTDGFATCFGWIKTRKSYETTLFNYDPKISKSY